VAALGSAHPGPPPCTLEDAPVTILQTLPKARLLELARVFAVTVPPGIDLALYRLGPTEPVELETSFLGATLPMPIANGESGNGNDLLRRHRTKHSVPSFGIDISEIDVIRVQKMCTAILKRFDRGM
jgi:hypothetical protein